MEVNVAISSNKKVHMLDKEKLTRLYNYYLAPRQNFIFENFFDDVDTSCE